MNNFYMIKNREQDDGECFKCIYSCRNIFAHEDAMYFDIKCADKRCYSRKVQVSNR